MRFSAANRLRERQVLSAFTLVELLVVIAIIGVLVSLLLPAVQAAREAARRVQCQSSLHNLALAVLNYESARGNLPPSSQMRRAVGGRSGPLKILRMYSGQQLSWIVQVLPYLEQQTLYDQFDLKLTAFEQDIDSLPERAQPSVLLCPSEEAFSRFYESPTHAQGKSFAKGNYAAYGGPEHLTSLVVWAGALIHKPQPLSRIEDGTTNTIMLSEIRTRDDPVDQRGAWVLAWPGSTLLGLDMHGSGVGTGNIAEQQAVDVTYIPSPDLVKGALPPNSPTGASNADGMRECAAGSDTDRESDLLGMPCNDLTSYTAAPRSQHTGGVNSANVDGSVHWLSDDVDPLVLGVLVSINEGISTENLP